MEVTFPQCSGLDVHLKFVVAYVWVGEGEAVRQERQRFATTTNGLLSLVAWWQQLGVTHVAMESTGVYWKPVYNILHDHFETWVVNARHLRQVPGRKTDDSDAKWITKLMRYGLWQPSFIPEEWQRDLRDLTRYRTRLSQERSAAVNRVHKVLEDANIKLGAVVADIQGVSARQMIRALIEDKMEPEQMAQLAQRRLRQKIPQLVEALTGRVRDHHRFLLEELLLHVDSLTARLVTLNRRISELVAPYEGLIQRLDEITGVGRSTAEIVLAEIGPSVANWPTSGHLASWACVCPGNHQSGGKRHSGKTRRGQKWLVPALVEAAWAASRTKNSYLSAQFYRLRARRGAKRAALAVAHSLLTIIYHLIKKPEMRFADLGGDYFLNRNKEREKRRAVRTLETLGFTVDLAPAPAAAP